LKNQGNYDKKAFDNEKFKKAKSGLG